MTEIVLVVIDHWKESFHMTGRKFPFDSAGSYFPFLPNFYIKNHEALSSVTAIESLPGVCV